jgi:hypothetical protein
MSADRATCASIDADVIGQLRASYPRAWARLRRIPGVSGLGIGVSAGDRGIAFAGWRVYVADEHARALVPEAIAGFATMAVLRSTSRLCYGNGREPTLKPGIEIKPYCESGVGTLGCFARLTGTDKIVILSNGHVLYQGGFNSSTGQEIGQPSVCCCCCCKCRVVATNHAVSVHPVKVEVTHPAADAGISEGNEIDAAIATLNQSRPFTNDSGFYGMISGTPASGLGISGGDKVEFVGSTSGYQTGKVLQWITKANYVKGGTGPIPDVQMPIAITGEGFGSRDAFINQIWIIPDPDPNDPTRPISFIDEGDSGAVVVNSAREVIGLVTRAVPVLTHRAFLRTHLTAPLPAHVEQVGIVCPIGTILRDLKIEIVGNMPGTAPASGDGLSIPEEDLQREREEEIALEQTLNDLVAEVRARAIGREVMGTVERHAAEVGELVNHQRAVMVTWHRAHGPAWAAHALNSLRDGRYVIPLEIHGVTRGDLVARMAAVLRKHGSAALRADLARYEALVLEWVTTDDTSVWPVIDRLRRTYEPDSPLPGDGVMSS